MRCVQSFLVFTMAGVIAVCDVRADDSAASADAIRAAIGRAVPLLEQGAKGSADQRRCFTCHSQAVPVFALVEAQRHGFAVDQENLDRQLRHTAEHLERGKPSYLRGSGQGGKVLTAGYALWTLDAASRDGDETTEAVTEFLLAYQKQNNHWSHHGRRPPSSGSDFTATYVALRGLTAYGTQRQQAQIDARSEQVRQWLVEQQPTDTEDHVFRLRALQLAGADQREIQAAVKALMARQRNDGGWAQLDEMPSDAYATGTALVALLESGGVAREDSVIRRGAEYLMAAQLDDGTWHVKTRADGFQPYFESGFPHGAHQFISIAASGWATLALLRTLPSSTGDVTATS